MFNEDLFEPRFLRADRAFLSGRRTDKEVLPKIRTRPTVQLSLAHSTAHSTGSVFVVSVVAAISVFIASQALGTGNNESTHLGTVDLHVAASSSLGPVDDHERSWLAFLDALGAEAGTGQQARGDSVRTFWTLLRVEAAQRVAAPTTAGRTDDGFVLAWDRAEHHLDVDLLDDGSLEWFYSDRGTDFFEGQERLSLTPPLPEPLLRYMKYFS